MLLIALIACEGEVKTGEDETSSVVATTTPSEGLSNFEEVNNPNKPTGTTSIEYMEIQHDFGTVKYPSENLYTFKFKNTGNVPLIIESANASCGCTIPNKPEDPILPGQIGELDVIFSPKEGQQGELVTKNITVIANTDPAQTYLEIKANVLAPMIR